MKKVTAIFFTFFLLSRGLSAFASEIRSGPERVRLIEVYTSEAKKGARFVAPWVSELSVSRGIWRKFVPVVFHVDPGPREVWKGKLMKKEFEERLNAYAVKWNMTGIYLPTVFLDGVEWSGWAKGDALPEKKQEATGVLQAVRVSPQDIRVTFRPVDPTPRRWLAHAVLLGSGIEVKAEGGENIGHRMQHDFSVLRYGQSPMELEREGYRTKIALSEKIDIPVETLAIAVWVTVEENVLPVQAAGGIVPQYVKKAAAAVS